MRGSWRRLALVVFIASSLCSTARAESGLVGKWKSDEEIMQFFDEGTVTIKSARENLTGNYKLLDKEHVRFDFGGVGALAGPMVFNVQVAGNKLTLKDPKKNVTQYERTDLSDDELEKQMASKAAGGSEGDKLAKQTANNSRIAEEAMYAQMESYVSCGSAEECKKKLPGFASDPGVAVSITAVKESFRVTASHGSGSKVYSFDSKTGVMSESAK